MWISIGRIGDLLLFLLFLNGDHFRKLFMDNCVGIQCSSSGTDQHILKAADMESRIGYSKMVYDGISGAYNMTLWCGQKVLVIYYVVQTFLVDNRRRYFCRYTYIILCVQTPEIAER